MFGVLVVGAGLNSNDYEIRPLETVCGWPIGSAGHWSVSLSLSHAVYLAFRLSLAWRQITAVLTNFGHRIEQRTTIVVQPTFFSVQKKETLWGL